MKRVKYDKKSEKILWGYMIIISLLLFLTAIAIIVIL